VLGPDATGVVFSALATFISRLRFVAHHGTGGVVADGVGDRAGLERF